MLHRAVRRVPLTQSTLSKASVQRESITNAGGCARMRSLMHSSSARPVISPSSRASFSTASSSSSSSGSEMTETTRDLAVGLLAGQRHSLARAITLTESSRDDHKQQAALLLNFVTKNRFNAFYKRSAEDREQGQAVGQHTQQQQQTGADPITSVPAPATASANVGGSNNTNTTSTTSTKLFTSGPTMRVGIAGPPGAGKSTFIEALGMRLIARQHRVAVIPVDPSSHISGGSILGDKTRMEELSKCPSAYVRASPTRGVLGGIAEHTADVITLCECAGYDVIIVESVGLGQSEVDIDYAVDMLLMVVPPGGGDGLQASKKGIMEAADLVAVNKADGSLAVQAKHTQADYSGSMSFIRQKHPSWQAKVLLMSARTGLGLEAVEGALAAFHKVMSQCGALQSKRQKQGVHWMWGTYHRDLVAKAAGQERVQALSRQLVKDMAAGRITPRAAANELIDVTSLGSAGVGVGVGK